MNISPWFVLVLGMGTVFFGLVALIFITKLMSAIVKKIVKPAAAATTKKAAAPEQKASAAIGGGIAFKDRKLLDAIIAAAIATYDGSAIDGLRIRPIKQLNAADGDRQQFVAAVSAAVATTMGTDVQGLRIHSIKKI